VGAPKGQASITSASQYPMWVLSWTDETWTSNEGEVERLRIHEDYLIENGKIRLVYQYAMKEAQE
jgi:hypothetical protein